MACPACQQSNPDGARFCLGCGGALAAAGAVVPLDPQRAALERALGAQYEIGRLLGRGGMGVVYLAREKALERAVAIKVLPPDLAADAESRERFRREARTAAKLVHPNIVPLYTFGDAEGMLFFVMGYVRGEPLGERMRREGRIAEHDVRRILGELAGALDYAHRQGVIHRDIKPDNVLLDDESGRPMLTDFGVAKARAGGATLTEVGAVVGTPHYMSPEQASGARDLDGRSDLYSLGVMGYAMLSGRLPFEGEDFRDVIVQHLSRDPVPLTVVAPDVPADLAGVVARCLAKEPGRRWPDGRAVVLALGETDDDTDDTPRPLSIQGMGIVIASEWVGAAIFAILGLTTQFFVSFGLPWWALPLVVAAVPAVPMGAIALLERWRRESWKTIIDRIMLPPRGWPFWWPKRWRRPGDVWDRLPAPLKRVRWMIAGALPPVVLMIITFAITSDRWAHELIPPSWLKGATVGGCVAAYGLFMGGFLYARRWAKTRGLSGQDGARLALAPTANLALWRKPKYAALLEASGPASAALRAAEPQSADEYLRAIGDLAAALNGPVRALGSEALAAARHAVGALSELDAEIAMLARDASPAEIAAVEQKLAALGPEGSEPASRRELRQMLVNQRDLLRRLGERLRDATARRERVVDLLRTLWLQVANLRAESARDALGATEVTGRIRALCEEISRHAQAAAEVRVIAPGSGA